MGLFSKLFKKKASGLPGLLELQSLSVSLSVSFPEAFSEHFNEIASEMLGEHSNAESIEAISLFAILITRIKILNSIYATRSEQVQNDIEKHAGMSAACLVAQIQLIDIFTELLGENVQTSKLQSYVKNQRNGCNSNINSVIKMTHELGLESFVVYTKDSFSDVLKTDETKKYIMNKLSSITDSRCI